MILYVLYEFIRINIKHKDNNALTAGLVSMLLLGFGLYLWVKNGLILDYGTPTEIKTSYSEIMFTIALISVFTGLIFILTSVFKFLIWKINSK